MTILWNWLFCDEEELARIAGFYRAGSRDAQPFGYGHAKQLLAGHIETFFAPARARYEHLRAHPEEVDAVLERSAARARPGPTCYYLGSSRREFGPKPSDRCRYGDTDRPEARPDARERGASPHRGHRSRSALDDRRTPERAGRAERAASGEPRDISKKIAAKRKYRHRTGPGCYATPGHAPGHAPTVHRPTAEATGADVARARAAGACVSARET